MTSAGLMQLHAPIRFIWYKEAGKEMKTVNYVFDDSHEDMFPLFMLGQILRELDIYVEHDISENSDTGVIHYLPSSQREDLHCDEDPKFSSYNEERENVKYMSDSDVDVKRSKEDEEPEQSEDERHDEGYDAEGEDQDQAGGEAEFDDNLAEGRDANVSAAEVNGNENRNQVDEGDEIILDAGDGANDDRFKSVFEEGSTVIPDRETYKNTDEEDANEREAADSDEEYVLEENAHYPDTPVESEEEWEQWANPKRQK
ncbi:HIV Tat-specific factor 1 homolog [Eutrema salsugineum]|uniref:HIV Tat-specific factor 1 homolog n=1 Tax=Eutrema salsugineum TaxID=72664 RepID=UPI000CED19EC|nr:HIV Tat-specific factor 1 homolog [Eutrema salsugineum]